MLSRTKAALLGFVEKYVEVYRDADKELRVDFDCSWESPCVTECDSEGSCIWTPTAQDVELDFKKLEMGMDMQIHPDYQDYFCCFWSDHLNARAARGDLQLLMVWNEDDFVRLQENLIAHLLMKRRLGQRDTLFFAQTEDENYILSVLNGTGEVVLEPVGQEPGEILASDLAEFISELTPVVAD